MSDKFNVSASGGKAVKKKAKKPQADFPLFSHDTGRWAKKVHSKRHYFGKVEGDPEGEAGPRSNYCAAGNASLLKASGLGLQW